MHITLHVNISYKSRMSQLFLLTALDRINKPSRLFSLFRSVEWPESRCNHAATCVNGSLLVIVGGHDPLTLTTFSDCWIVDLTTKQLKKV